MSNKNSPERNVTLLKIINEYKACSVLRSTLTVALAVSALYFQIFSSAVFFALVIASCGSAARSIYGAHLNAKMIKVFAVASPNTSNEILKERSS